MSKLYTNKSAGFTLVELSIVIIIIGFLIAGIAAGSSLIHQAKLNSVVTDMQSYQTAYNTFIQRYNGVPGDITNAESYFPAGGATACGATAGNCDGNGDGLIDRSSSSAPNETQAAWKEMSLAGIISAGVGVVPDTILSDTVGSTVPASKITAAGYAMIGAGMRVGDGSANPVFSPWGDSATNAIFVGKPTTGEVGLAASALKPEEAFNLDRKIDDGSVSSGVFAGAGSGKFRTVTGGDTLSNCAINTGANYDLTVDAFTCVSGMALN